MHVMFEVILAPGASADDLLTQETIDDTQAKVLTKAQAESLGFSGIPDDPEGRDRRFIVAKRTDTRRIASRLEIVPVVTGFNIHDFDK